MMALSDLINQNISKKMMLALAGMITLAQLQAPTWQIMAVAIVAIIAQAVLDYTGHGKGQNDNGAPK